MSVRTIKARSALFIFTVFLSTVFFILALGGCDHKPTTGPGSPDETQMQHYNMLVSAIDARSKVDALAALSLLKDDVDRWGSGTLTHEIAKSDLMSLKHAVDTEDWDSANKLLLDLTKKYRSLK
jgi:hypothetical protein